MAETLDQQIERLRELGDDWALGCLDREAIRAVLKEVERLQKRSSLEFSNRSRLAAGYRDELDKADDFVDGLLGLLRSERCHCGCQSINPKEHESSCPYREAVLQAADAAGGKDENQGQE